MDSVLFDRVKELCDRAGITIAKLEDELGFGSSTIRKWQKSSSPSIDKIIKVSNYFKVSTDYLLGRTDIEDTVDDVLADKDVITFQRARQKMPQKDRPKMIKMLQVAYQDLFEDDED